MKYKARSVYISLIIILFVVGIFIGGYITNIKWLNKLEMVNSQLQATQENLGSYRDAYKEALASAKYEYEVNELLEIDLAEARGTISDLQNTITDFKSEEYEFIYIGEFKLTHYCTEMYRHICGTGNGVTATGTKVLSGRTIAVDPKVIPYGSQVYIEGYGFRIAEDCGGAVDGNHIDIAVSNHSDAISMGTKTGGVWVLVKKIS